VSLQAWLEGIGVPPPQPFVPDAWQLEALDKLRTGDVVVSVPTGSGKTYVAVEASKRAIEENRTVIYTSPLKALSNTKYTEFCRIFGADRVGILTGDRRDNGQAPLLIMTTEILRNLLYDAAGGEIDLRLDTLGLVIMDESQYLADPERGVVWEETIIFCPSQAKLLLLSASIGNPHDVADWLTSIRPTPCHLIKHSKRTVPLRAGYMHPDGKLTPLFRTLGIPHGHPSHWHPEAKRLFMRYEDETSSGRSRR
jgi:superfamily II RNA helicase